MLLWRHVVIVAPAGCLDEAVAVATGRPRPAAAAQIDVVAGGAERSASVLAGLRALGAEDQVVLVHDAARALAPASLFEAVIAQVRAGSPAVVPGLPVSDTVKVVDEAGRVASTPPRERLRAIQTPQGFRRDVLERAHADGSSATDDAALVELTGVAVTVIDGDPRAVKVTTPRDLDLARTILQEDTHGAR